MMKKVIYSISLMILTLSLLSCGDKFLEIKPEKTLTDATFYNNQADAMIALNGVYSAMTGGAFENWFYLANFPAGDVVPNENQDYYNMAAGIFTSTNGRIVNSWSVDYSGIARANLFLSKVKDIKFSDEALKKRAIAEAKFLRGFYYYNLTINFGGVPLVLEPLAENFKTPRSPVDKVYEQILKDLSEAAEDLPESYTGADIGRATKGSALAYMAKVNLYKKDWGKVVEYSERIISSGKYNLNERYIDNFHDAVENDKESIFEVQARMNGANGVGHIVTPLTAVRGIDRSYAAYGGWGVMTPSDSLVKAFEPGDERLGQQILLPDSSHLGFTLPKKGITPNTAGQYFTKYWTAPLSGTDNGHQNLLVLRYAEVLLNYAEALNELDRYADALAQINIVRKRAKLPPLSLSSKAEILDAIFQERRVEFPLEYNFWYDLTRRDRHVEFVKKEYGRDFSPDTKYFPIPQSEIQANPMEQNPGY